MSANTPIIAVTAFVFALALALGWIGYRSEREARESLRDIASKRAEWDAGLKRLAEQGAENNREHQALQAALQALTTPGSGGAVSGLTMARGQDVASLLEANPGLFALGVRAYRANLGPHFRALYRSLGLSPEQIGAFENLMTEHQENLLDINATAASQGLAMSDPAVQALLQQDDDQLCAAQAALLGDAGYRQLQQFARAEPVQEIVANLATTVALTSSPLSEAQASELTRFLANSSASYRGGDQADPDDIDWDVALPQAQAILNGTQYSALRAESLKLQLARIQAQGGAQPAGAR